MEPEITLIFATFNRAKPLERLLNDLRSQTLDKARWEVIVAVDGSTDETRQVLEEWTDRKELPLSWFYQENSGQGLARHNGIMTSKSKKIIIVDDDMKICPEFIEGHLKAMDHADSKMVVIGKVVPAANWEKRPLYELILERKNKEIHDSFEKGIIKPGAKDFITQNVSFHKGLYFAAGGFNAKLRRGQDTFLGVQFEKAGARFDYCKEAWAVHESNIGSYETWVNRQYDYGRFAWLAWKMDGENRAIHPLKDFCEGNRLNKWISILVVRNDALVEAAVRTLRHTGMFLRKLGLVTLAIATHKAINAIKQNQGVRDSIGSWSGFRKAEKEYESRKPAA